MTDAVATVEENHAINNAKGWLETMRELVDRLKEAEDADSDERRENVEQEIQESVLSVMVRDGWRQPGALHNDEGPEEYEILLTTGGPALRIYGQLDRFNQPEDGARLQWQDWFKPWTDYPLDVDDSLAVDAFARQFHFGE